MPSDEGVLSKCLLLLVAIVHFVEDAVDDLLAGLSLGLLGVIDTLAVLSRHAGENTDDSVGDIDAVIFASLVYPLGRPVPDESSFEDFILDGRVLLDTEPLTHAVEDHLIEFDILGVTVVEDAGHLTSQECLDIRFLHLLALGSDASSFRGKPTVDFAGVGAWDR